MALRLFGGVWGGLILKFGFLFFGAGLSREFKINQHKSIDFYADFYILSQFLQRTKMQNSAKISFTIQNALKNELDTLSKDLNMPKSKIIARALELYFDTLDLKIAKSRLKNPQIIKQDEMKKFINEL